MAQKRIQLGAWLIMALSAGACGDDGAAHKHSSELESKVWATPLERDSGAPSPTKVMPLSPKENAYGTDLGGGNYHVDVRRADGFAVFASDFALANGQYKVGYTLFSPDLKAGSSAVGSNELTFARDASGTSLESAIDATTFLYLSAKQEMSGNYATTASADYHGCDLGSFGLRASCSDRGACCEVHDQCYIQQGCSGVTWLKPIVGSTLTSWVSQLTETKLTPAKVDQCHSACNGPVASCMSQVSGPGPAPCCADNTCGQPRVPGVTPMQNQPKDALFGVPAGQQVPKTKQTGGNFFVGRNVQPATSKDGGVASAGNDCAPDDQACKFLEDCDPDTGKGCQQTPCNEQTGEGCDGTNDDTSKCDEKTGEGCDTQTPPQCDEQTDAGCEMQTPTPCNEQTGEGCDTQTQCNEQTGEGCETQTQTPCNEQTGEGCDHSNGQQQDDGTRSSNGSVGSNDGNASGQNGNGAGDYNGEAGGDDGNAADDNGDGTY